MIDSLISTENPISYDRSVLQRESRVFWSWEKREKWVAGHACTRVDLYGNERSIQSICLHQRGSTLPTRACRARQKNLSLSLSKTTRPSAPAFVPSKRPQLRYRESQSDLAIFIIYSIRIWGCWMKSKAFVQHSIRGRDGRERATPPSGALSRLLTRKW